MIHTGKTHKLGHNIDTDAIIPAKFLVSTDPQILSKNCMDGLEEGWIKRVRPGDIMAAGKNFGCGSSREHAPLSIKGAGISMVIANSFARIFYRNAFNMGLILLEIGDQADMINDGDDLLVDTSNGLISNLNSGQNIICHAIPEFMQNILSRGGLVNYVKDRLQMS